MGLLPLGFFGNMGWPELLIILAIVLLIFGNRLPGIGRSLGRSLTEFKSGLKEGKEDVEKKNDKSEQTAQKTENKEQKSG